jgi:hypothetical protein
MMTLKGDRRIMKKLIAMLCLIAGASFAAPPPKYLDVDVNWQQSQELEDLHIQQGASMRLRVRPKLEGKWLTLTDMTGRWEAREQMTNTSAYTASSNLTSNEGHFVQIELDATQTGTSYTNWYYSVILIDGGADYPIGVGRVHVWPSDFAGSSSTLVGSGYETNGATASPVTTVNFGSGITSSLVSNKLTLSVVGIGDDLGDHTATQDLDMGGNSISNVANSSISFVDGTTFGASDVDNWNSATNGGGTTYDNGTGIALSGTTFSLSNELHQALQDYIAASNSYITSYTETQDLADVLALDNASGANDLKMSANALDQSRRIGFIVNDGFGADTDYLDSTIPGQIRYDGKRLVDTTYLSAQGYLTSYTEMDPEWSAQSNSFARTSGFQMLGNINLNAFTLDNGIVDADQLTTGTVPLSALSSITTNQMQGAAHALYVADTDTDTTYTAGTGIALAGGEFSASGVSTNEMAAATVAQIHAAGGASEMGDLSDVADLSGAAADEVLAYNGTMWTNAASGGGADVKSDYSNTFASVYLSSAQAVGAASTETIEFNAETHDIGGNFNTGTYTYTAPETGIYLIGFSANATSANNGKDVKILVYAGASLLALQTDPNSGGTASSRHMAVSHIQRLTAAQTVYARAVAQSGGGYTLGGTYSKMQIIKISE